MDLQLNAILNHLPQGVAVLNDNLEIVLANPILVNILCAGDQKPYLGVRQRLAEASQKFRAFDQTALLRTPAMEPLEQIDDVLRLDGATDLSAIYRPLPKGGWLLVIGEGDVDIKSAFALQNQRLDAALANTPCGLCMFDTHRRLILCNEAYGRLYDLPSHLTLPGTPLDAILEFRKASGNAPANLDTYYDVTMEASRRGRFATTEIKLTDGRTIRIGHNPLIEGGYVATHEDVTEAVKAAEQIVFMARHDPLTGLCNRALLREKLDHELTFSRARRPLAVACIDLDRFKAVNDTLGHPVGDALLKAVTERIQACLREGDTLARFGGDEFVALMADIPSKSDAARVADRIITSVSRPFQIGENQVEVGASIGIALSPGDADSADLLIAHADRALYRAKADGRGVCRFFENEMDLEIRNRNKLEGELRQALDKGQFEVHYQPEIDVRTKTIVGFEALLRWRHPEKGLLLPADFIPLAEETGVFDQIGDWVIGQACRDAKTWPSALIVTVNISPTQIKKQALAGSVSMALDGSGLDPRRLELEVTEGALFADYASAMTVLHQLKALGVRIAVDNFGSGLSSLNFLRQFPFDKLKIDRSFVGELVDGSASTAIVSALVGLSKTLGMCVAAEGVETEEQMRILDSQGCTEAQGFLISRPLPAADVYRLIYPDLTASVA